MNSSRPSPGRATALSALKNVRAGVPAEHALDAEPGLAELKPEDRRLATELVYGVLRRRDRLDDIIRGLTEKASRSPKPDLRDILRIALYQLIFLDRAPDHAVVHEAALMADRFGGPRVVGFVNAALRRYLRDPRALDPLPKEDARTLARYYSHPVVYTERALSRFGLAETTRILEFNNTPAPLEIRLNRLRADPELLEETLRPHVDALTPITGMPGAYVLSGPHRPLRSMPGFSEGLFTAQNRASQLVAPLTAPAPGERVLDACGAPGQKAAHMAQLMGNRGRIVVLDIDAGRAGHTRENLVRMGAECAAVELGNAADPATFSHMGVFDRALVDAPCSNSGVLRHNPEAKYRLTLERIRDQADLQLRMLCACGEALRRDGILVYAVCSVTEEETTSVVERFLRARTDYAVSPFLPVESPIPGLVDARGFFATFPPPPEFPCDGFFVARFVHIG